jgi:hypothetical protein
MAISSDWELGFLPAGFVPADFVPVDEAADVAALTPGPRVPALDVFN